MDFPLVVKRPGAIAPVAAIYYEVAANGVFQIRESEIYRAVTREEGRIPGLLPATEELELKLPRLPASLVEEVLGFFHAIYRRYRGEAIVILFYEPKTREFRVAVPRQSLPGRRTADGRWRARYAVRYCAVPRPPGFLRLGSIHSHADLPASASEIDCEDEEWEDGLHVVVGDFDRADVSLSAAFVANRVRFRLRPEDVLEPCEVPQRWNRPEWIVRVRPEAAGDWSDRRSRPPRGADGCGVAGRDRGEES
ncbi:MAG: hypothetical protein ACREQ9_06845 [Candidatus Binatia bacterium]